MATNYEVIKAQNEIRELLKIEDNGRVFSTSLQPFGPGTFESNTASMRQTYAYPVTRQNISFRPPRTRESILAAAHRLKEYIKPRIFNSHWLQAGLILQTGEGIWTNVLDVQGQPTDEANLRPLLTRDRKVNGIYLLDHGRAFIPHDSSKQDFEQEAREFAEGGLARGLEHTPERVAKNLESMAKKYPKGVYVAHFGPVNEPTVQVAGLGSDGGWDRCGLRVDGDGWYGGGFGGYAFGVLQ